MPDNGNLNFINFPAIFKQEATFLYGNLRDAAEEIERQINCVNPKVVFIETRMLDAYHDFLKSHRYTVVVMDREPGLSYDFTYFWDLIDTASDNDNDAEFLDVRKQVSVLRFTIGTTGNGKFAVYAPDHFLSCRDSFYMHPDFNFDETTRYLAMTPLSSASVMLCLAGFFIGGATYTLNTPDLVT